MVAYGFTDGDVGRDLALVARLRVSCLELFPQWRNDPDPLPLRRQVADAGLTIHSAHGCWGGHSIAARRVDLGCPDPDVRRDSLDDLRRCVDWLAAAGGRCLVVHPGGLSRPAEAADRRVALSSALIELADHAMGTRVVLCVENMPPGVSPGSRMADLAGLVAESDRPEIALAIDTGHANLVDSAASETLAAGRYLATTHVHDNDGRRDIHLPPGLGTIDWGGWVASLDQIDYRGPIMLECIRHLREHPDCITDDFVERLAQLSGNA